MHKPYAPDRETSPRSPDEVSNSNYATVSACAWLVFYVFAVASTVVVNVGQDKQRAILVAALLADAEH